MDFSNMQQNFQTFLEALEIMGVGWTAIFGVTLFIILCIFGMNKLANRSTDKDE